MSSKHIEEPEIEETRAYVIGIAGGTASGKTTLSNKIKAEMQEDIAVLEFDSFYHDLEPGVNPANYDFDHPSSLDFEAVYEALKNLREMKVTRIPVYSFITNSKIPGEYREIQPKHFVIFEGIMAFYDERIRDLLDLKIFIHCDSDISLCRRVIRDIQERGRDATEVLTRYNRFVREDYNNFVKPCMKYADIVLPGGANNSIGFQIILENLRNQQKKVKAKAKPGLPVKAIENLVLGQDKISTEFSSSTIYDLDLSNSHTSLMLEGLIVKFTNSFFHAAVSYWEGKLIDKIHNKISQDFKIPISELIPQVNFCSMENFLMEGKQMLSDQKTRVVVIIEPFLFESKLGALEENFTNLLSKNKSGKMIYIISIMNDYGALRRMAFINPMVRIMMLFCITDERSLISQIRIDGKDETIEVEKFKKIFYLVPCSGLVARLQTIPELD